jgi:hypothetical protein
LVLWVLAQVLLRFNTFFKVVARLHGEADKKRVLHELAACAPALHSTRWTVPHAAVRSRAHCCTAAQWRPQTHSATARLIGGSRAGVRMHEYLRIAGTRGSTVTAAHRRYDMSELDVFVVEQI